MYVYVFFPFILDIKFVGRTSRGHTGGRSHRISHPLSFCGACLYFSRGTGKDSAIPFPRRPWSRILYTNDLINRSPPVRHFFFFIFLVFQWENPVCRDRTHIPTCQRLHGTSEDLIITILPVVTKDLPISPRFTPYHFLSRCKFSTLTTRQPMVEFYLLTFPRFPLRKNEYKSYFGKNRTHDFRTSRCAGYLLDH